ncbi:MAG: hypothetical protein LBB73_05250 [Dysgonamonadaceae bacterium]|jgi:hypothetical protein|nr:hypothetical protein [Dysgonamonadaceae bacterium]
MRSCLFFISILLLSFSCNKKGNDARVYLANARFFYDSADYGSAQKMLDSLTILYPDDWVARKESLRLGLMVDLGKQTRNLAYCDSLLQIRSAQRDSMKPYFLFEKNTEYDETGKYYAKSQKLERNLRRSYIRSGVNESGTMELASIYCGAQPIRHTGLKVSNSRGEYTETEAIPCGGGMNYSFADLNMTTETVTYTGGKDNGVIRFIYNNKDAPLKAEYTGGNKKYSISVSQADKAALADVCDFSVVLSDIDRLNKEMEKSSKRIAYLRGKM